MSDNEILVKVPFTRSLTVVMTEDNDMNQADKDVAAIKDGGMTIRTGRLENYFHKLRLAVAKDPFLAKSIVVFYPTPEGLKEIDITNSDTWPVGFLNEAWDIETEIMRALGKKE